MQSLNNEWNKPANRCYTQRPLQVGQLLLEPLITICMNYGISSVDACVITTTAAAAVKLFAFLTP